MTVTMDQGGESHKNPKVVNVLKDAGHDVCPTGADAPHQNGLVEWKMALLLEWSVLSSLAAT